MCGVAGLKPTYDRLSRAGVGPLGFTLDHVGPIARTVEDTALCFESLTGDPMPPPVDLKQVRVGIPKTFFFDRVDPEVRSAVLAAAGRAQLVEVEVPDVEAINAVGRLILLAETATVWRRYLDRAQDFGLDVRTGIEQGRLVSAADYLDAQRLRGVLAREFASVWLHCDVLLTPTTPTTAPPIGLTNLTIGGVVEDVRLASTRLVRPFNVLGWPALSVPCGKSSEGLPIGLQLVAPAGKERLLLATGMAFELL
jgi:aspartyl-tRNA(Asn)/glutamyl-tRNA(Gln) amidotransferase subunit A